MTYNEILNLALTYADRSDSEVTDRMDDFLKMVESRVNRKLDIQKMAVRSQVFSVADKEYYGLPTDFKAIRDIEISDLEGGNRITLEYLTPEQMNAKSGTTIIDVAYYTIIADQFQIYPAQTEKILEIVYYQQVPPLTSTEPENWLTSQSPDCYVFGLMVEINAFVKDAEVSMLWDGRFTACLDELDIQDAVSRWSGTPMQMRIG